MRFDKYVFREDFIFKNNRIHLTASGLRKLWKAKKLTGSRIGSVFGNDSFRTPFQAWCDILGFFKEEPDLFFINAGRIIEPKLKKYAEEKMGFKFISYEPKRVNYDLFSDDKVFGGIPDGEEYDENGKVVSILEIKTAQVDKYKWNFQDNQFRLVYEKGEPVVSQEGGGLVKWFKNGEVLIPESYKDQLSLYLYLRGIRVGYFCVAFLKHQDYLNPEAVEFNSEFNIPNKERILVWQKFEIDLEEQGKRVEQARKWYEEHIKKGISPELTTKDLEWFRYGYPDLEIA